MLAVFLGWLGVADFILLEFWLVLSHVSLIRLPAEQLILQIYVVGAITAISAVMLIFGSYLMMKNRPKMGGIINLITVIVMALTYTYFAFLSEPQLLNWLGITGYFLISPALVSGVTVIVLEK